MTQTDRSQERSLAKTVIGEIAGGIGGMLGGALLAPTLGAVAGLGIGIYMTVAEGMPANVILFGLIGGAVLGAAYKLWDIFG